MYVYVCKYSYSHIRLHRYLPDAIDSVNGNAQIGVHKTIRDRVSAAKQLVEDKGLRGDVVVDSMDNSVSRCECM
jgi:hypothetical protein